MGIIRPDGGEASSVVPVVAVEVLPSVEGLSEEKLKKLGNFILQGMNENESATLAGVSRLDILRLRRTSDSYNIFIEKKKLEFKHKHLKVLSVKSDPKISQWLLERLSPEEFSTNKKKVDVPVNAMAAIIKDIQEGGDDGSALAFAYDDHDINAQGAPRNENGAADRLRSVLE